MRKTKAHEVVDLLVKHQIQHIFGIPGTHNIELFDALHNHPNIKPILITDEQSAGFMADGYARASGKMAALALVPGAGLTHALSGIAEAYLDQVPLLVLACGVRQDTHSAYQLHDIDQLSVVKPVSKWTVSIKDWSKLDEILSTAIQVANQAPKGPVVVELPAEGLLLSDPPCREQNDLRISDVLRDIKCTQIDNSVLKNAVVKIQNSKKIGLYIGNIGHGRQTCSEILQRFARHLDAWVWSTISAKGLFPETNARFVWNVMGSGAPEEFQKIEAQVDLWIVLGARFGEVATASYGFVTDKPMIHVDLDPKVLESNRFSALTINSDAFEFVDHVMNMLTVRDASDSTRVLSLAKDQYEQNRSTEKEVQGRITPRKLLKAMQAVFPENTIYAVDSGNGMFLAMENLKLDHPGSFLAPVDFSCMGYCIPASIGAKIANPDRTVVAMPGDGAFLMTGLELLTAKSKGVSPLVFLLRDGELSQISQFQKESVVRTTLTQLPDYDASKIAEALGFEFCLLSAKDDLESSLRNILQKTKKGTHIMVEVPIDYSVKTAFTKGVLKTNFKRFPLNDKVALVGRFLTRKTSGLFGME